MKTVHRGACLCGEIRFEICGDFEHFYLCHCGRCRKATGSAHSANLFSSSAELKWLSGEGSVRHFKVPDTRHQRSFCAKCGAGVPTLQMDGAVLALPAGSLVTPIKIRPNAHICVASRAEWDDQLDDVPKFDDLPS